MKLEVRLWKSKAKEYMPPWRNVGKTEKLSLRISIAQRWWYKNGNMKRQDMPNMLKVIIDAIAERYGFDDMQVWSVEAVKVEGEEAVEVKLEAMDKEVSA